MVETLLFSGLGFAVIVIIILIVAFALQECKNKARQDPHFPVPYVPIKHLRCPENIYEFSPPPPGKNCRPSPPGQNPSPPRDNHPIYPSLSTPMYPIASAPLLTDLNPNLPAITSQIRRNSTKTQLQPFQKPPLDSTFEIRAIQTSLIRNGNRFQVGPDTPNLIISVHADFQTFSGYCVDLQSKRVEFYKLQQAHFPWASPAQWDLSEFQMQNFSFALMAFFRNILEAKTFSIHLGAEAGTSYENVRRWRRAAEFLDHLLVCEGVSVSNKGAYFISWMKDPCSFAIKILPAEDLAANNFSEFREFVSEYYQILPENFKGSHFIPIGQQPDMYEHTELYQGYIEKVKNERMKHSKPCSICAYFDEEAASATSSPASGTVGWGNRTVTPIGNI